jgi:hypothetical protein
MIFDEDQVRLRQLLPIAFTFFCGVLVGRILPGPSSVSSSHSAVAEAKTAAGAMESNQASAGTPAKPKESAPPINAATPDQAIPPQFSKPTEISIIPPKKPVPVLDAETETQLTTLITSSLPPFKLTFQKPGSDGSYDVSGKTEDGKDLHRHFNSHGELTQEGWTDPSSGEQLYRTFYDNGKNKQSTWKRRDKSYTSISFTESGLYESRYDRFADGSAFSTAYDDAGEIKEIWKIGKDGKSHMIFP